MKQYLITREQIIQLLLTGFHASGEGYNGEYGPSDEELRKVRFEDDAERQIALLEQWGES